MNTIISSPKEEYILHMHIIFLTTTPNGNPKREIYSMHTHFPMGPRPSLAQRGGGHVPEMPPTYDTCNSNTLRPTLHIISIQRRKS